MFNTIQITLTSSSEDKRVNIMIAKGHFLNPKGYSLLCKDLNIYTRLSSSSQKKAIQEAKSHIISYLSSIVNSLKNM